MAQQTTYTQSSRNHAFNFIKNLEEEIDYNVGGNVQTAVATEKYVTPETITQLANQNGMDHIIINGIGLCAIESILKASTLGNGPSREPHNATIRTPSEVWKKLGQKMGEEENQYKGFIEAMKYTVVDIEAKVDIWTQWSAKPLIAQKMLMGTEVRNLQGRHGIARALNWNVTVDECIEELLNYQTFLKDAQGESARTIDWIKLWKALMLTPYTKEQQREGKDWRPQKIGENGEVEAKDGDMSLTAPMIKYFGELIRNEFCVVEVSRNTRTTILTKDVEIPVFDGVRSLSRGAAGIPDLEGLGFMVLQYPRLLNKAGSRHYELIVQKSQLMRFS